MIRPAKLSSILIALLPTSKPSSGKCWRSSSALTRSLLANSEIFIKTDWFIGEPVDWFTSKQSTGKLVNQTNLQAIYYHVKYLSSNFSDKNGLTKQITPKIEKLPALQWREGLKTKQ